MEQSGQESESAGACCDAFARLQRAAAAAAAARLAAGGQEGHDADSGSGRISDGPTADLHA